MVEILMRGLLKNMKTILLVMRSQQEDIQKIDLEE